MNERDASELSVELIDEQTTFTLAELCRRGRAHRGTGGAGDTGSPSVGAASTGAFPASSLQRTRITLRLQRDLGVNLAGAALTLDLLEHIEELEARMRTTRGGRLR